MILGSLIGFVVFGMVFGVAVMLIYESLLDINDSLLSEFVEGLNKSICVLSF